MGVFAHHAIVVSGCYGEWPEKAHAMAWETFPKGQVSLLSPEAVNGYRSFCIFPDGSKEGWCESYEGNAQRDAFIGWLREQAYEDGSSPLSWAEVCFGEIEWANEGAKVTRHAWEPSSKDEP